MEHVSVSKCYMLTDAAMHDLSTVHTLAKADISFCPNITGDGVLLVAQACPHLTHLSIRECSSINNSAIAKLKTAGVVCTR